MTIFATTKTKPPQCFAHTASPSLNPPHSSTRSVHPASEAVGNITDVRRSSTHTIAEVAIIDTARVVLAKGGIDGLAAPLVAMRLQVTLEVLGTDANHIGNVVLSLVVS